MKGWATSWWDRVGLEIEINLISNHSRNEAAKETIRVKLGEGMLIV